MTGHAALMRLSWPAPALWQNRPSHWAQRARAVKAAKREAWAVALEQGVQRLRTRRPVLVFTFHPPPRGRRPDMQNMPATMKAAIDGIAEAMNCDDAGFRCVWPVEFAEPVKGGAVLVEVSAGDDWQQIGDVARGMARGTIS